MLTSSASGRNMALASGASFELVVHLLDSCWSRIRESMRWEQKAKSCRRSAGWPKMPTLGTRAERSVTSCDFSLEIASKRCYAASWMGLADAPQARQAHGLRM